MSLARKVSDQGKIVQKWLPGAETELIYDFFTYNQKIWIRLTWNKARDGRRSTSGCGDETGIRFLFRHRPGRK